jgi:hypothetical protein
MPLLGTIGAGSSRAFGLTAGGGGTEIDYMVLASGGGGGQNYAAGGGGGGFRTSFGGGTLDSGEPFIMNPDTTYTITVGGSTGVAGKGSNSGVSGGDLGTAFNSTGGGRGAGLSNGQSQDGGSAGGGPGQGGPSGGNEGGYTPAEGNGGGSSPRASGGGAANAGGPTSNPGGQGYAVDITGASVTYGGGGGGGGYIHGSAPGPGGAGGGGNGGSVQGGTGGTGSDGQGGGGGGAGADGGSGGGGGSGRIVLRGPSALTWTVAPGTNSTSTAPDGSKVANFTVTGTASFA